MPIALESPVWLLALLVVVPAVAIALRMTLVDQPRIQLILSAITRACVMLLLVLALTQALWSTSAREVAVVLLADASDSVPEDAVEQTIALWESLQEARGAGDALGLVRFGREPVTAVAIGSSAALPEELPTPSSVDATGTGAALRRAMEMMPGNKVPRIVLLGDGNDTEGEAESTARRMAAAGIPIFTVPYEAPARPEVLLRDLVVPQTVAPGEPFRISCVAESTHAVNARFTLFRDGFRAGEQEIPLEPGANTIVFDEPRAQDGPTRYELRVAAEQDTFADNNVSQGIVYAAGEPRILILESDAREARHLARALEAEQIRTEVRDGRGMPSTLEELASFDAVIYADVPAAEVSAAQMTLLRRYIEELGGGFIMVGGEQSFDLGGYYRTEIEDILPVRMRAEQREDLPGLAMIIVLDRSGSMQGDRIELAREASIAAVELLGPRDEIGVVVFDSQAHWVVELQSAGNQLAIIQAIESIAVGGGTNIYPGLVAAHEALSIVRAANKHVVLLSDGHSQPGDFPGILDRMAADRITVSSIGVGEGVDANLLQDIARRGRGRYYYTADPYDMPQIFTQETMSATKSSLVEEPVLPVLYRAHQVAGGIDWTSAPYLFGYIATTPKPTAEVPLGTEHGDPLLAIWRVGLGQAAAFTSDAKGRWAGDWLTWPGYTQFWAQLVRQVARSADDGIHETVLAIDGADLRVTVDAFDENSFFVSELTVDAQAVLPDGGTATISLAPTAPGRYEGSVPHAGPGSYLVRVTHRAQDDPNTPPLAEYTRGLSLSYLPEYRDLGVNEEALAELAAITGGAHRPELAEVFALAPDESIAIWHRLWSWILALAMLLFVLDVALRRVDLRAAGVFAKPERYG